MSEGKEILGVKTNHPYVNEYRDTVNNLFINTRVRDVLENFFYYFERELKNIRFGNFTSESEVRTFVETIFVELSYAVKQQSGVVESDKLSITDILLFKNQDDKEFFEKSLIGNEIILSEKILLVIEVKSPDIDLGKSEDQFYDTLNQYKRDFGIITNGYIWRFYDKSQIYTGEKKYIEFDFSEILKNKFNGQEGFLLFYYLVRKDRYLSGEIEEEKIERIREQDTIKKTLKEILYANPDDSIVFKISKNIYEKEFRANPYITFKELETILEESIIFVLRIFFIAYIEDKFRDVLEAHAVYKDKVSFRHFLYPKLTQENIKYSELLSIFLLLDKGMDNGFIKFPMFNGGLFCESKARHLTNENLLTTEEIKDILTKILFFKEENARNKKYIGYSKIDVKSFGELYEALLEYDLRIAQDIIYRIKVDGHYLIYTENNLPTQYKNTKEDVSTYYKGDIYLTSMSLNRKKSGAFYTPDNLTEFMATSAIEEQLKNKSPFNIKIIDNACGSGHFLISSLNYLTDKVYASIDDFKDVKSEMENEHRLIKAEIRKYGIRNIDDKLILKRMLLKKCIYGVDINPIAVEVTMLSLWINTFIFGTPLSFIEHHIKTGNALIGYISDEFYHIILKHLPNDASLWLNEKIKHIIKKTEESLQKLKLINDITKEQVEASKIIYSEYKRDGYKLRLVFSLAKLYELYSIKSLELSKNITFGGSGSYDVAKLIDSIMNDDIPDDDSEIIKEIEAFHDEYKIFHYGIEFPDAANGFEIVIGNPPWKKAKFNESEFFAKYNPDYRKLSILEQNKFKSETMGSDTSTESKILTSLYGDEKRIVGKLNDIYKNGFKKFSCGGDPNLFRYFVAFNLKLIARRGNLTYLIPSCMWSEHSSQKLRIFILKNYKLNYLYQFQNNKRFTDVVSCFKFAIFQISNNGSKTSQFKAKFMIQKDDKIVEEMTEELKFIKKGQNFPYKGLHLSLKDIKDISPVKYIVAEYRSKEEFNLTKKMFKKFDILCEDYINFGEGLHATKYRSYFKECDTREDDSIFLYKGANVHQFNSRYFEKEVKGTSQLLWISKQDLKNIVPNCLRYENFKIQYRKIARNTDERTMISALKPRYSYCTYSLYLNYEKPSVSILKKLFIISVFNSLTFDFLIRKFVEINVQKTFLYQCPMPQPTDEEILSNPIYLKLVKNACILTVKNDPSNFSELLGIKELKFTEEEKAKISKLDFKDRYYQEIEREINFIVAFLYSLTPGEFSILLEDFKVLKKKKGKNYFLSLVEEYARWLKEEKQQLDF